MRLFSLLALRLKEINVVPLLILSFVWWLYLSYMMENFQGPITWLVMELGYIILPLLLTLTLISAYSSTHTVFNLVLRKSYFKKFLS